MDLCIYHANCADGFGAAWAVRKAFEGIEFFPGRYQEPPPDVTGRDVLLVDFSYPRNVLLEMAGKARSILIIDHHLSAYRNLSMLPDNVATVFDMSHSGAMLTWRHFFNGVKPPELFFFIEDRDLWLFDLPATESVMASVFSYDYDFVVWDTLLQTPIASLITEGEALLRKHKRDVKTLLSQATRELVIGGYRIPAANVPPFMASDAGHELAKGNLFSATYWDSAGFRIFSLRSNAEGVDVSAIAQQYGGGGHEHAAGFKVSLARALAFEINLYPDTQVRVSLEAMKESITKIRAGLLSLGLLDPP